MDSQQSVNRVYTKPSTSATETRGSSSPPLGIVGLNTNNNQNTLIVRDLLDFLKELPPEKLHRIYCYPAICFALFRALPELARQFIMRIVFVDQPVPKALINTWCSQQYHKQFEEAAALLTDMSIWHLRSIPGGLDGWELCEAFKRSIKLSLLGGGKPWLISHQQPYDRTKTRDVAFLDSYAMSRWRAVLLFLVGLKTTTGTADVEGVPADAVRILLKSNLMRSDEKKGVTLTQRGFQFLLLDTHTQIWHFLLEYLDSCTELGFELADCLSLIFQLSLCTIGREYSSEHFSEDMLAFLQHLRECGIVFQRKRKDLRFYPTRLALVATARHGNTLRSHKVFGETAGSLTKNAAALDLHAQLTGFIIVETNFRVYAHTDSQLHIAVLGLFTELLYRFPNLVVGVLTRHSVRQALRVGITAKQIERFLIQYADPHVRRRRANNDMKNLLPPTVVDQIYLWEQELNRLTYTEGVIYTSFLSQNDFCVLRDYAKSIDALIWQNERTRNLICSKAGHDEVRRFWRRYSKSGT